MWACIYLHVHTRGVCGRVSTYMYTREACVGVYLLTCTHSLRSCVWLLRSCVHVGMDEFAVSVGRESCLFTHPGGLYLVTNSGTYKLESKKITPEIKRAIETGKYTVSDSPSVCVCGENFLDFVPCTSLHLVQILGSELSRSYGKLHDIIEEAKAQGAVFCETKPVSNEKIHSAEIRRKNLSSINPNVRAKKVTKGFSN